MEGDIVDASQLKDRIENLITRNKYFEARRELSKYSHIPLDTDLLLLKIESFKDASAKTIDKLFESLISPEKSPKTFSKMPAHCSKRNKTAKINEYKTMLFPSCKTSAEDCCTHADGYLVLGQTEKAREHYEKALEADPEYIKALEDLMDSFTSKQERPSKRDYAQKILDLCPHHHDALEALIDYLAHDNQVEEARVQPRKARLVLGRLLLLLEERVQSSQKPFPQGQEGQGPDLQAGLPHRHKLSP